MKVTHAFPCIRVAILALGALCCLGTASAAEPAPSLAHFLIPVCSIAGDYVRQEVIGTSSTVEAESTALNTFGISGVDWKVLSATCSRVNNFIAKIGVEARTLHPQIRAQGREADQAFVVKYNSQRDNVLAAALSQIRSRMSPQGWGALQRYLATMQQNSKTVRLQ